MISTTPPMSPFRFEDFMMNTYAKRRKEDEKEKTDKDFLLTREKLEGILHHLRTERDREIGRIRPQVTPLLEKLEKLKQHLSEKENDFQNLDKELSSVREKLSSDQSEFTKIKDFTDDPTVQASSESIEFFKKQIIRAETLKNNISNLLINIEALENQKNRVKVKIENLRRNQKSLETKINEYEKRALSIEKSIREVEEKALSGYTQKAKNIAEKLNKNAKS